MQQLNSYIQTQLVADQPGLAIEALQVYHLGLEEAPQPTISQIETLVARYEVLQLQHTHPDKDPSDFRKSINQLNLDVARLSWELPSEANLSPDWEPKLAPLLWELPEAEEPKEVPKGIPDQKFQWHILILIFLVKAGIFLYMSILQEAGALSTVQFQTTLSVLIPVVAAYVGTMFKHLFSRKDPNQSSDKPASYTSRSIQGLTYGVFAVYIICYFSLMTAEGKNDIEFKSFVFWINAIEAIFGVLIGYVVSTLFEEKKQGG